MKNTYNIPFGSRQLTTIEKRIRATLEDYLNKNDNIEISEKDFEFLIGKSKDQLSGYIKSLCATNEPWGLSHTTIPITVHSKNPRQQQDLLSLDNGPVERFIKQKNNWVISDDPKKGMLYESFQREVFKDIYSGAEVAAFYAIDSFLDAKMKYPNG